MIQIALVVLLNSGFWVIVHFASGLMVHIIPDSFYAINNPLFSVKMGRYESYMYRHIFRVNFWKDKLGEAGTFLGIHPFSKKKLASDKVDYIERFILETCRGEFAHILPLLLYPLCLFWNPWPGNVIMALYALTANIPCIVVQRYNRIRLIKLLVFRRRNGS